MKSTMCICMNKTKRVYYNYKISSNEYIEAIITIRIQLRWVKQEENCEMLIVVLGNIVVVCLFPYYCLF